MAISNLAKTQLGLIATPARRYSLYFSQKSFGVLFNFTAKNKVFNFTAKNKVFNFTATTGA